MPKKKKENTYGKNQRFFDGVDKYVAQNITLLLKSCPLAKSPLWPLEAAA